MGGTEGIAQTEGTCFIIQFAAAKFRNANLLKTQTRNRPTLFILATVSKCVILAFPIADPRDVKEIFLAKICHKLYHSY